ncbi:MAG: hypothetical protein H0U21_11580 [Acidimicrobiia bacterium]|nr:hypothetical protein [Acidimicrobiia bacterium]
MGWKATGAPTVRKQRDKWVVRIDGIDTASGKARPRQLGTYASQRSALAAARSGVAGRRSTARGTVSWLVRRYVAGRTDITQKSRESYEWAIPHIEAGLGAGRFTLEVTGEPRLVEVSGRLTQVAVGHSCRFRTIAA